MKNVLKVTVSAAVLSGAAMIAVPSAAQAQEVSANVSLVSNYVYRGLTLSGGTPAIQGGIDLNFDTGFYVGTWASSIDTITGNEIELDFYMGYGGELGNGLEFDLGVLAYTMTGAGPGTSWDDTILPELYASVGGPIGPAGWTLSAAYIPDIWNAPTDNIYVSFGVDLPFGDSPFYGMASIGYEDGFWGDDKIDWMVGLGFTWNILDFNLSYVGSDDDTLGKYDTILFGVTASF